MNSVVSKPITAKTQRSEGKPAFFIWSPLTISTLLCGFLIDMIALSTSAAANSASPDMRDCLDAPFELAESSNQLLLRNQVDELRVILVDFPSLLSTLNENVTQICFSDQLFAERAYLDSEANRIVLASDMPAGMMQVILVHEVRHANQIARGICPSDNLGMAQYARAVFSLEADASVVSLLVAWKQKADGNLSLWRAIEEWPMTSDIAFRFKAAMDQTQDVSEAATAAFAQWYASEMRREIYYVASCSDYLHRQEEAHALPRYLTLPADHFSKLCQMPDGRDYQCKEPPGAIER